MLCDNVRVAQAELPVPLALENIAALRHVAGGTERDGLYHDTHAHPVPAGALALVSAPRNLRPVRTVRWTDDRGHARWPPPARFR